MNLLNNIYLPGPTGQNVERLKMFEGGDLNPPLPFSKFVSPVI